MTIFSSTSRSRRRCVVISSRISSRKAEGGERHAVGGETLVEFVDREIVLTGDLFDRGVHHLVVDADAGFLGALHDGAFRDQTVEHLGAQGFHGRQLNVLTAQIDRDHMGAVLEFTLRDDVLIDDGHDAVEFSLFKAGDHVDRFGFGRRLRGGRGLLRRSGRVHDARGVSRGEAAEKDGKRKQLIHSSRKAPTSSEPRFGSDSP